MNETSDTTADGIGKGATAGELLRKTTLVVYILYAASVLVGITGLIGVVIAHLKRREAVGTIYESHLVWLIRTFWIGLAGVLLGLLLSFVGIGALILLIVAVWFIYRMVAGFLKFNDLQPITNPQRLF